MKTFRSALILGALTLGANTLFAAQPNQTDFEKWFKAKFGTNTPTVEARLNAERANTAFRAAPGETLAATNWIEQHFKAKLGRNTRTEEARLTAERDNTAYRAAPVRTEPARTWFEQWYRAKYGR